MRRAWRAGTFGIACAAWTAALWLTAMSGGTQAQGQQSAPAVKDDPVAYLPPAEGKAVVEQQCTVCHDLGGVISMRKGKADWESVVTDMVSRGAPLTIEEVDAAVAYLSTVFSATSPPLVDVNTATQEELTKLPGVTPEAADKVIAHRTSKGRIASRDELQAVLGLDDKSFDKIKWYLRPAGSTATP